MRSLVVVRASQSIRVRRAKCAEMRSARTGRARALRISPRRHSFAATPCSPPCFAQGKRRSAAIRVEPNAFLPLLAFRSSNDCSRSRRHHVSSRMSFTSECTRRCAASSHRHELLYARVRGEHCERVRTHDASRDKRRSCAFTKWQTLREHRHLARRLHASLEHTQLQNQRRRARQLARARRRRSDVLLATQRESCVTLNRDTSSDNPCKTARHL